MNLLQFLSLSNTKSLHYHFVLYVGDRTYYKKSTITKINLHLSDSPKSFSIQPIISVSVGGYCETLKSCALLITF